MRILLSGGFDPLHSGHIDMIQRAKCYGDVHIALNSDTWLRKKKGKAFMSFSERRAILLAMRDVTAVHHVDDTDGSVCEAIARLRPDIFGNGGDRNRFNSPETALCLKLGVMIVDQLGPKIQSSSSLLNSYYGREVVTRPWGFYRVLYESHQFKVKLLHVNPFSETSVQRHAKRNETWIWPEVDGGGGFETHRAGYWHQLVNPDRTPLELIEVQTGTYFGEDDIERRT